MRVAFGPSLVALVVIAAIVLVQLVVLDWVEAVRVGLLAQPLIQSSAQGAKGRADRVANAARSGDAFRSR